jgi:predicted nucleotidyltransferase
MALPANRHSDASPESVTPPKTKKEEKTTMKVSGIIAEYNPFHNGHKYQLMEAKKETHADYLIIAMSGDFLQRGVPAMLDKYARARMALDAGADLVLEIPVRWASASAEYFGAAGVSLLAKTGVVQTVCYGCESVEPALARALSFALAEESDEFSAVLREQLKQGLSYPAARCEAASRVLPGFDESAVRTFLASPNNILALEYEKAIARWNAQNGGALAGHAIRRIGEGYHSTSLEGPFASATAIRQHLLATKSAGTDGALHGHVPAFTRELLEEAAKEHLLLGPDDFSEVLYARLWSLREDGYGDFADCGADLSHRIARKLDSFICFTQFAELLKSRDLTYTRVCRALLHILLGIHQNDYNLLWEDGGIPYLRVLGFRKESAPLLSAIKKEASAPLVTKAADASQILSPDAMLLFEQDIRCAGLYRGIAAMRCGRQLPNEYTQGIILQ